jgi:hypothetical protein
MDSQSSISADDDKQLPSHDLELTIARPGEARFFALMLFGLGWMLAHAAVASVALAWKTDGRDIVLRYLAFALAILFTIPGLRNAMPDAPGYDGASCFPIDVLCTDNAHTGVLIDQIGFFAQMFVAAISTVVLLATLATRELAHLDASAPEQEFVKEKPAPIARSLHRMRGSTAASIDFRHLRTISQSVVGLTTTVEPPTPVVERSVESPYMGEDPFATRPSGKVPSTRWGFGGQRNLAG